MEHEAQRPEPGPETAGHEPAADGLLGRVSIIEAQPLEERARGFEQLHDELLAALQRSDQEEG